MMKSNLVLRGLVGTSTQTKPVNADFHIRPTPQLHAAFAYVAIARPAQHSSAAGQVNTARVKVHLSHCIVLCSQGLLEVLKFCNCFLVVRLPPDSSFLRTENIYYLSRLQPLPAMSILALGTMRLRPIGHKALRQQRRSEESQLASREGATKPHHTTVQSKCAVPTASHCQPKAFEGA